MAFTVTLAAKRDVASGAPATLASTVAFAVGDIMDFAIGWTSSGDEGPTMTDNLGGSTNVYTEKTGCRVRDATNGQSMTVMACEVTTAGTPSWTPKWGGADRTNVFITATKIEGGSLTGTPPEQGNSLAQAAVGTGADAAATETVTPGANGACIIGSVQDVSVGGVTLTKKTSATALSNTGATDGCGTQYEIQSSAAAYASTWTLSASRDILSAVRSYAVDGGGGSTQPPRTYYFNRRRRL